MLSYSSRHTEVPRVYRRITCHGVADSHHGARLLAAVTRLLTHAQPCSHVSLPTRLLHSGTGLSWPPPQATTNHCLSSCSQKTPNSRNLHTMTQRTCGRTHGEYCLFEALPKLSAVLQGLHEIHQESPFSQVSKYDEFGIVWY